MYGLACYDRFVESGSKEYLCKSQAMLQWLDKDIDANKNAPLNARFFMPTYYLSPPWPNAMTFGLYLSLASRLGPNERAVKLVLNALFSEKSNGGVLRIIDGDVWLEEYPSKRSSLVFNGHNFGVIGLFDVLDFMSDSQKEVALSALRSSIRSSYRITIKGGWTYYDLKKKTLSTSAYQRIHVEQMNYLSGLATGRGLAVEGLNSLVASWGRSEYSTIPLSVKLWVFLGRSARLCERFIYACLRGFK